MGSNSTSTSDQLHQEADAASAPRPQMSEILNPKQTLARREATAGLGSPPPPAAPSSGAMSQADFSGSADRRSRTPPAELLRQHREKP